MYRRYLPTLTLKKQQLQAEIRTIEAAANAVRQQREALETVAQYLLEHETMDQAAFLAVFGEKPAEP